MNEYFLQVDSGADNGPGHGGGIVKLFSYLDAFALHKLCLVDAETIENLHNLGIIA